MAPPRGENGNCKRSTKSALSEGRRPPHNKSTSQTGFWDGPNSRATTVMCKPIQGSFGGKTTLTLTSFSEPENDPRSASGGTNGSRADKNPCAGVRMRPPDTRDPPARQPSAGRETRHLLPNGIKSACFVSAPTRPPGS